MTWTRERPKGVDAMRNYQPAGGVPGARQQEFYDSTDYSTEDRKACYTDSWWHPVRADGRYPALPVEDGRKWVREYPAGMTWYSWKDDDGVRRLDRWISEEVGSTSLDDDTWCLPYIAGDTHDTLPPLPSAETPAPLTPAEEATLRGEDNVAMAFVSSQPKRAIPCAAPEPSRLEIAARFAIAFYERWPTVPEGSTPEDIAASRIKSRDHLLKVAVEHADALIAAARKESQ